MPSRPRQLTYEEAIFAWMADWQPDVRVLEPAEPMPVTAKPSADPDG